MLTFGSLFAGIGGFDLGLERAGMACKWQVEIDDYCQKILTKHWPDVPKFRDIKKVGRNELETVDVICGGFPCQPFSVAGKREGRNDNRYLWPEMLRIITELQPRWVIAENVPGLFSISEGMVFEQVCIDLEYQNYEVWPFSIPACGVDAPHKRERAWILAANSEYLRSAEQKRKYERAEKLNGGGKDRLASGEDVAHSRCTNGETCNSNRMGNEKQRCKEEIALSSGDVSDPISIDDGIPRHGTSQVCRKRSEKTEVQGCSLADSIEQQRNGRLYGSCRGERKQKKTLRDVGGGRREKDGLWLTEPSVGRVANGIPSTLDETIKDYGHANANHQEAIPTVDKIRREILREMWSERCEIEPPSYSKESQCSDDSMHEMPCQRTHDKWKLGERIKTESDLRDMWEKICSTGFAQTQNLQQAMLERIREIERNEKVASSRVGRLKCLGNAVVPQIPEILGKCIIEIERGEK